MDTPIVINTTQQERDLLLCAIAEGLAMELEFNQHSKVVRGKMAEHLRTKIEDLSIALATEPQTGGAEAPTSVSSLVLPL